ncbi:hypothetical protein D6777_03270 [Candidatus Woesearchaeota archaeon]|nr:MAG: hypothetical protein D6777_03270 [Candidatus Woesearchaeota archaeon]
MEKVPIEDLIEMRCYLKYNLYYGQPKEKVIQALIEQGWKREEIEQELKKLKMPKDYIVKSPPKTERKVIHNIPIKQDSNTIIPLKPATTKEEDIPVPLPPKARTS